MHQVNPFKMTVCHFIDTTTILIKTLLITLINGTLHMLTLQLFLRINDFTYKRELKPL
jgi:hypothetical protein